jgi:hypothetical protein
LSILLGMVSQAGKIELSEPVNGNLQVVYTRRQGNFSANVALDLLPFRRATDPDEIIVSLESLALAAQLFHRLGRLTSDTLWERAAVSAQSTLDRAIAIQRVVFLFKKLPGQKPLAERGLAIVSSHTMATTVYRSPDGFLGISMPTGSHDGVVSVRQILVGATIQPATKLSVELSTNIPAIIQVLANADSGEWRAEIASDPEPVVRQLIGSDFLRWTQATEWHASGSINDESYCQGNGSVQQRFENAASGAVNPLVKTFTLMPNLGTAGVWLMGNFSQRPSRICYRSDAGIRLQVTDGDGWNWEAILPSTNGTLLDRSIQWSDFRLASTQEMTGSVPREPWLNSPIQRYGFVSSTTTVSISVQYIGEPPQRLQARLFFAQWRLETKTIAAHTLMVGNIQVDPDPDPAYRVDSGELIIRAGDIQARGNSLTWKQRPDNPDAHRFWADAQAAYFEQTGILGPFRLSYRATPDGQPGFIDNDPIYDLSWGGWQALTGATIAQAWHTTQSSLLHSIAANWIGFLDNQWGDEPATILTPFTPFPNKQPPQQNSAIAALYCRAALFFNIAGGDRVLSFRVLQKSLQLLTSNLNYNSATNIQQGGSGATEILQTIAHILIYKDSIKYPLPSETGETFSEFAAQVLRFESFAPALEMPQRGIYGFTFRVPIRPTTEADV